MEPFNAKQTERWHSQGNLNYLYNFYYSEEFRYLEGVNILYSLLSQVTDYETINLVNESSRMNLYG
jgi:hypothetical protein